MAHRANFYFSDQSYKTLGDLSARSGLSMSEVLRKSLNVYRWFVEVRAQGNHVLIERADGTIIRVMSLD